MRTSSMFLENIGIVGLTCQTGNNFYDRTANGQVVHVEWDGEVFWLTFKNYQERLAAFRPM